MEIAARRQSLCSFDDVHRLVSLLVGGAVAGLLPRALDEAAADFLMRVHPATQPRKLGELAGLMAEVLSPYRTEDWTALANEHARTKLEDYWGRFRGVGPRGWHPPIEFEGEQYIRRALEDGKGAVIWCMRFSSERPSPGPC